MSSTFASFQLELRERLMWEMTQYCLKGVWHPDENCLRNSKMIFKF